MSASEKLKALGERNTDAELQIGAALMVLDALPQIVAVIEAAEKSGCNGKTASGETNLHAALTALEEALGGDVT